MNDNMKNKLSDFMAGMPEVHFAYMFGSRAACRHGPLSDVDVAVELDSATDPFGWQIRTLGDLEHFMRPMRVDLVVLNSANISLRYEVQAKGLLVFERDADARCRFEADTRRDFWDYLPLLETYVYYLKKRLEDGTYGSGCCR